jgi:hypothetical protein
MRPTRPAALILALLLAGCATAPKPATPVAPPPPVPTIPLPPPGPVDWADLPLSPGGWRYDAPSSTARFGAAPDVTIRCDKATRTVVIARAGATGPLTIRTSYGTRVIAAPLAANDPLLDRIAFSRGRWSIESAAVPIVVMPAWAEPARVFEDCRG